MFGYAHIIVGYHFLPISLCTRRRTFTVVPMYASICTNCKRIRPDHLKFLFAHEDENGALPTLLLLWKYILFFFGMPRMGASTRTPVYFYICARVPVFSERLAFTIHRFQPHRYPIPFRIICLCSCSFEFHSYSANEQYAAVAL